MIKPHSKPQAFTAIAAARNAPLFIFGDHASRTIPAELNNLGLSGEDLTRHIAWDSGTEIMARALCVHFGCGGLLAGVSRLVIDCNRDPAAPGLIPKVSDGTVIPGNQDLSAAQRQRRRALYYDPYHAALSKALDRDDDPLIVSLHSFTPKPKTGDWRMTEIGFLYKGDLATTLAARQEFMRMGRGFTIGMNEPYSAFDLNYTVDEHVIPRGLRHLTFEVRQDLIDSDEKAKEMAVVIARVLKPLISLPYPPLNL